MPLLARAKRRVAMQLGGDRLILADAAETRIRVLLDLHTGGSPRRLTPSRKTLSLEGALICALGPRDRPPKQARSLLAVTGGPADRPLLTLVDQHVGHCRARDLFVPTKRSLVGELQGGRGMSCPDGPLADRNTQSRPPFVEQPCRLGLDQVNASCGSM